MTTIAPPRPDGALVDELEQLLEHALPCEAEDCFVGDRPIADRCPLEADWRIAAPCCGSSIDLCTPHADGYRSAQGVEWCGRCNRPTDLKYRRL